MKFKAMVSALALVVLLGTMATGCESLAPADSESDSHSGHSH